MIQILPDSNPSADPGTVLQAINVALQGPAGLAAAGAPKMHRTYRNATKNLPHSTRNMIGLLLPEFDFSWCLPENVLVPQQGMQRYRMTLEEKAMHNLSPAKEAYFLHDPSTGRSIPDFPSAKQHQVLRLCFASDEGSDVFGLMQWLCHSQCHCLWWPDTPHKLHRKQAGAFAACEEGQRLIRLACKVFRATRAPWSTSRFGRARKESRARMIGAMEQFGESELLQCHLAGR